MHNVGNYSAELYQLKGMRELAPSPSKVLRLSVEIDVSREKPRRCISSKILVEDIWSSKEYRIYEFASKILIKSTESVATHPLYLNIVGIFGLHLIVPLVSREGSCRNFPRQFVPRGFQILRPRVSKLPGSSGSHIISSGGAGIL